MSTAPWRDRVTTGNANEASHPDFAQSYPEKAGMGNIVRGTLYTVLDRPRRRFNFLVNPSDVQAQYGVSDALNFMDPNAFNGNVANLSEGLNSITFAVMLDRTYEVYYGRWMNRGGVLHDVRMLEKVAGIPETHIEAITSSVNASDPLRYERAAGSQRSSAGQNTTMSERDVENAVTGLITKKPLRAVFGASDAFSFDGFISSMSVHYTHFSRTMVPTRAGVSISMTSRGFHGDMRAPERSSDAAPEIEFGRPGAWDFFPS